LTIDTLHHILPDFFWRETNDAHAPVGGLAPLQWSKEAMISFDGLVLFTNSNGVYLGDATLEPVFEELANPFATSLTCATSPPAAVECLGSR
jgi:hypothetical protein